VEAEGSWVGLCCLALHVCSLCFGVGWLVMGRLFLEVFGVLGDLLRLGLCCWGGQEVVWLRVGVVWVLWGGACYAPVLVGVEGGGWSVWLILVQEGLLMSYC